RRTIEEDPLEHRWLRKARSACLETPHTQPSTTHDPGFETVAAQPPQPADAPSRKARVVSRRLLRNLLNLQRHRPGPNLTA
ncbi:hypothetical protein, partial [Nocardioides agariphilus]|uniref:hypothetical protein n=1 Tax=Nocardioides agariphilus TaxID=433664 RepID=UPI001E351298